MNQEKYFLNIVQTLSTYVSDNLYTDHSREYCMLLSATIAMPEFAAH